MKYQEVLELDVVLINELCKLLSQEGNPRKKNPV